MQRSKGYLQYLLPYVHAPSLLFRLNSPSLLSSGPDISSARAAAALTHLNEPRNNGESTGDPHACKHGYAKMSPNVDVRVGSKDVFHDGEQGSRDDGGRCYAERVQERNDTEAKCPPAAADGEGKDEDKDEGQTSPSEEKSKHDLRDDLNDVKDAFELAR